ncbi:MAG: inositol monophosphatase family protein [Rickettsiales bacterium]|nr:inositol monophosphatase family protein [Pseudomonadota bacterium]MDA0966780.1 inositol monophosphatase family protein [Pseudomonadota bacterium]MDG4543452.1 inositol monophosphatase family protein [Rickettsiales bacterium]MDG4546154.1 inositol monophosphatase family protein [Rickettsiales bacterium]MDG4547627.1 inositol monophosphatase family protein [Rickettsiales bacterium]
METYPAVVKIMMDAIRKASRRVVRDFYEVENLQVSKKGARDFVTSADLKAESILIAELQKAREGYSILSEEVGFIKGSDEEYCWIIDPIDGTNNFMHGFPYFCITIGLEKKLPNGQREIIAGVTEAPILKETFWAAKGLGAWLETADTNGSTRLRVSSRTKLSESLLSVGSFSTDIKENSDITQEFMATRCIGSTALAIAYTAAGKFDCFIHNGAKPWDIAAGVLLISEAKGVVCDINGKKKMFENNSIIASNADIEPLLMKKLC